MKKIIFKMIIILYAFISLGCINTKFFNFIQRPYLEKFKNSKNFIDTTDARYVYLKNFVIQIYQHSDYYLDYLKDNPYVDCSEAINKIIKKESRNQYLNNYFTRLKDSTILKIGGFIAIVGKNNDYYLQFSVAGHFFFRFNFISEIKSEYTKKDFRLLSIYPVFSEDMEVRFEE